MRYLLATVALIACSRGELPAPAALSGPRKDPELTARAAKLLPADFTGKPMVLEVWTWRPVGDVELLVATVIDDPDKLGKPKGDLNHDYGGLIVMRRLDGKLELLHARKTGESPPTITGEGATIRYTFAMPCSELHGTLSWTGAAVKVDEQRCQDL